MARKSMTAKNSSTAAKMKRKVYEKELHKLQVELCRLQDWVKAEGARAIIVFEGRDAAGKGGMIKAIAERVSPRVFRVVALPAPSDREKSQMYIQRYMQHFPAAGEIVIFDRSWYNRAGVEYVMGFCTKEQHDRFLAVLPENGGFLLRDAAYARCRDRRAARVIVAHAESEKGHKRRSELLSVSAIRMPKRH